MGTSAHNLPIPDNLPPYQSVQIWMASKHMGNLLLSLRAIETLVKYYSAARCTLVIDEAYRDIMAASGINTEIVYFPRKAIEAGAPTGKVRQTLAFVRRIRRPKPVIAIAVEGDKVSRRFMPLSGCKYTVGPDLRECRHFKIRIPLPVENRHIFHTYCVIAEDLSGNDSTPGYVKLMTDDDTRQGVNNLLTSNGIDPEKPYAVLHPCATKDYKQWPVACFAQLAEALLARDLNVIVTGAGDFDKQTIDRLLAISARPLPSLHNQLSLKQFIALLCGAHLFVGNDTGPTHLAAACGIPTFALFGPTDEALWGPLGDNTSILRSDVTCEPTCLRRECPVDYRCMKTLSPEAVEKEVDRLLSTDETPDGGLHLQTPTTW